MALDARRARGFSSAQGHLSTYFDLPTLIPEHAPPAERFSPKERRFKTTALHFLPTLGGFFLSDVGQEFNPVGSFPPWVGLKPVGLDILLIPIGFRATKVDFIPTSLGLKRGSNRASAECAGCTAWVRPFQRKPHRLWLPWGADRNIPASSSRASLPAHVSQVPRTARI